MRGADNPGIRRDSTRAAVAGAVAALALCAAVYLGSSGLRTLDAALIPYTAATIILAFGVTYRYAMWVQSPPTRRYLRRGWGAFFSLKNFRRAPMMVPREVTGYLGLQLFIRQRGKARWIAHLLLFWGVILATAITFPLTWGWISFEGTESSYTLNVVDRSVLTFDPQRWVGFIAFHGLDISAALVLVGCAYFLWRRLHGHEVETGERLGYDFLPLLALIIISVTGVLLTFSSELLDGAGYQFLAVLHMTSVVLTLVFIPFGKFFHVIQRPANLGVRVYKETSEQRLGTLACVRCGEPLEGAGFIENLQGTMAEMGLKHGPLVTTCPRCKRESRGEAYLTHVKRGF